MVGLRPGTIERMSVSSFRWLPLQADAATSAAATAKTAPYRRRANLSMRANRPVGSIEERRDYKQWPARGSNRHGFRDSPGSGRPASACWSVDESGTIPPRRARNDELQEVCRRRRTVASTSRGRRTAPGDAARGLIVRTVVL